MAVLVTLLGVVLVLLGILVAGLLRSHAEILRALHDLGVDLDPRGAGANGAVTTAVGSPVVRGGVQATDGAPRPGRTAVDVAGSTPTEDAIGVSVAGTHGLTLLSFLSSGCSSCIAFWDAFADDQQVDVPGGARLVIVTKSPRSESLAGIRRLAPTRTPVVMSDDAWDDYDVPVAPFFVLADGESSMVIGEGAANTWEHVTQLMQSALADAGMLDRRGRMKEGARPRISAEVVREARADRELLAAGIRPGDPSLYQLPDSPPPSSEGEARDVAGDTEGTR
jgi:hypothetical protein